MAALNKLKTLQKVASTTASPLATNTNYVMSVTIKNPGSGKVFVGDASVSATTGFAIANGETVDIVPDPSRVDLDLKEIYVITETGTSDVQVYYVRRD